MNSSFAFQGGFFLALIYDGAGMMNFVGPDIT